MAADPLREKLRALVEEWRNSSIGSVWTLDNGFAGAYVECAKELAAILDETEPKPLKLGHEFVPYRGYFVESKVCIFLGCGQPREAH